MHGLTPGINSRLHSLIQCLAMSFARPKRRILSTSSPFASLAKPFLQSHPLFLSSWSFSSALLLPMPLLDSESSIELPTKEKLLLILLMDFLRSSRDGAGARCPWYASRVDRKHSSHCAYTREVTVWRSSIAFKRAKHWGRESRLLASAGTT